MPEGDTVHKLAAYLQPRLAGRTLRSARFPRGPHADLAGRAVREVRAHGKHLFVELDDGTVIRSHLGMWGSWHRYPRGVPWKKRASSASVVLETDDMVYVCFSAREVEVLAAGGRLERDVRARLGPDLTRPPVDLAGVAARARRLAGSGSRLVDVLLDQRVAAGIGNVYKSEVLFLEGVSPHARLGDVDDDTLAGLYRTAVRLLGANLGGGPRVTRSAGDGRGRLWVYGRAGRPCHRCNRPVRTRRTGSTRRSTYWCDGCQPEAPVSGRR